MMYTSTRDKTVSIKFSDALVTNLSTEGGLFVPVEFPAINFSQINNLSNYPEFAFNLLTHFTDFPTEKLKIICEKSFNFPLVLTPLDHSTSELELYHGPTAAFKDFGARFLANCLDGKKGIVLVATSGDTGGAVADAFWKNPKIKVVILFPNKKVSKRQEHQLTSFGENIFSYAIDGTFDDCQKIVKESFTKYKSGLISANSVNVGRILPQMVYYAYSSMIESKRQNGPVSFIIPTGNVGNSCAALWAKKCGYPIDKIIMATNNNMTLSDYYNTGNYIPRGSIETLANAMDVGAPSNFERVLDLYDHQLEHIKKDISIITVNDTEISALIKSKPFGRTICPHTACAYYAYLNMFKDKKVVLVSTAHPSKFETIVEPMINSMIEVPKNLQLALNRKSEFKILSINEATEKIHSFIVN